MDVGVTVGDSIERVELTSDGFDFVEFGIGESLSVSTDVEDDRLENALAESDLTLDVHLPFKQVVATPVPEINDAIVAFQSRLLEWAGALDARKAVLHGTVRDPYDTDLRPVVAEQVTAIAAAGEDVGVEVVLENVGHQDYGLQLSVLGDIAEDTGVPVCFDVGHAYMEEGNDGIKRFCKFHGDQISHLHVHDARRRGDTHLPVGAGEIEYDLLDRHLHGFDGTVAVEVFTDDRHHLRDSARRIAKTLGTGFPDA